MPQMLATALKGIPRDSYKFMTKYRLRTTDDPKATIDRSAATSTPSTSTSCCCTACAPTPGSRTSSRLRDAFSEAKSKKIVMAHGASCHGLIPLRTLENNTNWLDVTLLRINHNGTRMDTLQTRDTDDLGDVNEVVAHAKKIHASGTGVLGMKLIGEGRFTSPEDREAALKFAMGSGAVDAVTIGYKNTAEIDEAIERMKRVLNS